MPSPPSPHASITTTSISWQSLLEKVKTHKPALIKANVIALAAALVNVITPLFMPMLVDEVLLSEPGEAVPVMQGVFPAEWHGPILYISAILVLVMSLRVVAMVLNVIQGYLFSNVAKDVMYQVRVRLLNRLNRVSMGEYETLGSGNVTARLVTDINTVDDFVGISVSKLLISALTFVGVGFVLLYLHWQLALFILLVNPVVIYFTKIMGKHVKELKRKENSAIEVFQQALGETLDSIQQIRASNRERHYLLQLLDYAKSVRNHATAFTWKSNAATMSSFLIFMLGFDIFRAMAMIAVVYSDLSVGEMMAVYTYLWVMMGPLQELLNMQYSYFSAKAAMGRLNELLVLEDEPQYPHEENPFANSDAIAVTLKDIHFAYNEDAQVLNGATLDVKPGEKVALVGASGGGKSTMIQVLLGLYTPQQGDVYFNGISVKQIGLDIVRKHVATVLQQPAMLNDTIENNITMGLEISEEAIWQALSVAQIDDFVREQPDGLATMVGRQGIRLSGGQRQRLAIARMVIADPKVVVLDEATSALDNETEAKVHTALGEFLKGRTTIIVAHRLSAVKQADTVYVFEDGHIAEQGSHDDLLDQKGLYAKLYGGR